MIHGLSFIPVYASQTNIISEEEKSILKPAIEMTMEALEESDIVVEELSLLYDINNEPSYILSHFVGGGYAIFTRENIVLSEYSLEIDSPYSNEVGQYLKYGGYNNYSSTDELLTPYSNDISSEIVSANQAILNENNLFLTDNLSENPPLPSTGLNVGWRGVDESRMKLYNWPHFEDYNIYGKGICGTVTSTILLAYYDDYVDNRMVPSIVRNQFAAAPGMLYDVMFYNIDQPHPNGTLPGDIAAGINKFFNTYRPNFEYHNFIAREHIGATMGPAITYLNNSRPIALGLLEALPGNPYGNHWVMAYAYSTDPSNTYYKVVDTWAPESSNFPIVSENYRAAVHKTWTSSFVSLDQF